MPSSDSLREEIMKATRRGEVAFTATVVALVAGESQCTVDFRGAEVPAYYGDQVSTWIAAGLPVTLVPVGDTLEVISTRGGSGGVGTTYGPELLPNPSFEYGSDKATGWYDYPWVVGSWDATRDTAAGEAFSGSARMRLTLSPGSGPALVRIWNQNAVRVDPGKTYRLQALTKASTLSATLSADLTIITAPTAEQATFFAPGITPVDVASVTSPGAAWQPLAGTVTVPTGHQYARVYLTSQSSVEPAAPLVTSWDGASLKQQLTT